MDKAIITIDALAFCLAYTIPVYKYLGLGRKKILRAGICFCTLFSIELYCKFFQPELANYSFYICCLLVSSLIQPEHGFLKGINISVTILTIFICGVTFVGSIALKIFPEKDLYYNLIFNIFMDLVLLFLSALMAKQSKLFFRQRMSKTLSYIDIIAKTAFSLFINLFLPLFFLSLGKERYADISLTFLIFSIIFFIHISYSQKVENSLNIKEFQMEILHEKTRLTSEKYQELIEIKAASNPDNTIAMKDKRDSEAVQNISIYVIRALLYELIDSARKHNINITFFIEPVNQINKLNDYDLYTVLNTFIKNALQGSAAVNGAAISVWINNIDSSFVFKIESANNTSEEDIYRDFNHMSEMINNCKDVTLGFENVDKLIQWLEVTNEISYFK